MSFWLIRCFASPVQERRHKISAIAWATNRTLPAAISSFPTAAAGSDSRGRCSGIKPEDVQMRAAPLPIRDHAEARQSPHFDDTFHEISDQRIGPKKTLQPLERGNFESFGFDTSAGNDSFALITVAPIAPPRNSTKESKDRPDDHKKNSLMILPQPDDHRAPVATKQGGSMVQKHRRGRRSDGLENRARSRQRSPSIAERQPPYFPVSFEDGTSSFPARVLKFFFSVGSSAFLYCRCIGHD